MMIISDTWCHCYSRQDGTVRNGSVACLECILCNVVSASSSYLYTILLYLHYLSLSVTCSVCDSNFSFILYACHVLYTLQVVHRSSFIIILFSV